MRGARAVIAVAAVLGLPSACRHEPTLDEALSRDLGRAVASASAPNWRTSCAVTEGDAGTDLRRFCRRQCSMHDALVASSADVWRLLDAGPMPAMPKGFTVVPLPDGGTRWLDVTRLTDGGARCDELGLR